MADSLRRSVSSGGGGCSILIERRPLEILGGELTNATRGLAIGKRNRDRRIDVDWKIRLTFRFAHSPYHYDTTSGRGTGTSGW